MFPLLPLRNNGVPASSPTFVLIASVVVAASVAQEPSAQLFGIQQQPLSSALIEFARQGDFQLIAPSRSLETLHSNEVR